MNLDTPEWIALIGIILATVIGVIGLVKKGSKTTTINANQSSGMFSKTKQKQTVKVKDKSDG